MSQIAIILYISKKNWQTFLFYFSYKFYFHFILKQGKDVVLIEDLYIQANVHLVANPSPSRVG